MISKLTELIEIARNKPMRRIAVAAAADEEVLRALKEAVGLQIVHPILVGNKREIEGIARSIDFDLKGIETIDHDESASVFGRDCRFAGEEGRSRHTDERIFEHGRIVESRSRQA